jgi:hypothetical protein
MELFQTFPDSSQVWIYGANRFFTSEEEDLVQQALNEFTADWAAHGSELRATSAILFKNFIVIVADENIAKASGCSIDSSVRFIKEIGSKLKIDFFNRLYMLIEKDGELKRVHFSDLSGHADWNVFNPLVKTLGEMKLNWIVPVNESDLI